jgi:hypothetical protein
VSQTYNTAEHEDFFLNIFQLQLLVTDSPFSSYVYSYSEILYTPIIQFIEKHCMQGGGMNYGLLLASPLPPQLEVRELQKWRHSIGYGPGSGINLRGVGRGISRYQSCLPPTHQSEALRTSITPRFARTCGQKEPKF